jgi:hypothetical protein
MARGITDERACRYAAVVEEAWVAGVDMEFECGGVGGRRVIAQAADAGGGIECLISSFLQSDADSSFDLIPFPSLRLAGCGPAATHFSCFAKKSKQKKATPE